ncbi:MAG: division/cell wall cluster transcriptional repressor MraZ [Chloroflexi bacterium]|nr:MAG: division/cell wall cluster transcriptional repressor MraZ [Chloroflexota bacterium]MCE7859956.1 division/cell wall cluster transcriptional repressor MraZ [Chloroflexi bacterium CFX2]
MVRAPGFPAFTSLKGLVAQMFLGQFQHNLDDKGRLMIPARFRELLEGGAFITQGFDKCLMVMTEAYFKQVYERIEAMNLADPTARMLRRLILANAYPIDVDKIGRILVPQNLRTFLGIANGELVVAGQGEYFEVWTPATWGEQMALLQDVEANNARFSTLDLSKTNSASS